MIRIVSDTSTLYSTQQAQEAGFSVSPLSVTIAGNSYREFDEISSEEFVSIIREGNMPTSSQPSIGDVAQLYEKFPDDEIINITMTAGLSGTYDSAVTAAQLCENSERITVVNSRTLCGPHRYMVEKAVEWANSGVGVSEIVTRLEKLMETEKSFLMPADFDYLRRGGRLSPLVSYIGAAANLVPAMTMTEDVIRRLTVASVKRGFAGAIKYVGTWLAKHDVGAGWLVSISHADALDKAEQALGILKELVPGAEFEILPLSPAFITQGGPGCVAVQTVKKYND